SGAQVGYGAAPSDVVVAGRSVWLLLPSEQLVLRVATRTRRTVASLKLPWLPLPRLAAGDGYVWAAEDGGSELARISTSTRRLERYRPNNAPTRCLATGGGRLWVALDGLIASVVPGNGTTGSSIPYDGSGTIAFGDGALWSLEGGNLLRKLDPHSGRVLARRK